MKRHYWSRLPVVGLWIGFIVWFLARQSDWPNRVARQIDWSGQITAWGSPWLLFGLVAGLGLVFIGLSFFLDALWAQQETRKRFNFLSLLDELVVSLLVGLQASVLVVSTDGIDAVRISWIAILLLVAGMILVGALIELGRPYQATANASSGDGPSATFTQHLAERLAAGETLVYWDIQNPKYVAWLSIGIPVVLWISSAFLLRESAWAAALNGGIGVLLLMFYGGQRTRITRDDISIRYGLIGIRIFRCRLLDVASIQIRTFAPLADFGGYGIRVARGVTAYYLLGRSGVQLGFASRRSVLIGSNHPERLAAVLEVLSGVPVAQGNEVVT